MKLTECKAAQKKWKDKSANDSPLLAGEQWQRSGETPGSSVLPYFFPLWKSTLKYNEVHSFEKCQLKSS